MVWRVSLQIEEETPFGRLYRPGDAPLPEESEAADMYRLASSLLCGAGYEHYESSSFALPGHRCALPAAWKACQYALENRHEIKGCRIVIAQSTGHH